MQKFLVRAVSGLIYAAVIVFAIIHGGWALWLLAASFAVIGVCELNNMAIGMSNKSIPVYLLDIVGVLSLLCIAVSQYAIIVWLVLNIARTFVAHRLQTSDEDGGKKAPGMGQAYLGIPFAFMLGDPMTRLPLFIFVMLWLNDTGAYIVGSLIGKHKMSPNISPKKTWEGLIGGIVIAVGGSIALSFYLPELFEMQGLSLRIWILLALTACIFGTFGDLLESKIKRHYGVKDSGSWIPGHGGILDRIDSFLIAYPAAVILFYLL